MTFTKKSNIFFVYLEHNDFKCFYYFEKRNMATSYSIDLRTRIVQAYKSGLGSRKEIGKIFNVALSSVQRYLNLDKYQNGDLSPKPHQNGNPSPIEEKHRSFFENIIQEKPEIELSGLVEKFYEKFEIKVGKSSIARALIRFKITRKKNFSSPKKRDS